MRRATFINIKLYIEGTRVILLSFTESCKWGLVEIESLLMGAMNGLLDFESDRNSFAVIGSFEFSVPSVVLKKIEDSFEGEMLTGTWGIETWGVGTCVFGGK